VALLWGAAAALVGCGGRVDRSGSVEMDGAELLAADSPPPAGDGSAALQAFSNPNGKHRTVSTTGAVDETSAFFQSLGVNGRSCASCHIPEDGWTVKPASLQARFAATDGMDPVFRLVDGANSPLADVSTVQARQSAYSMLLGKGLIRVGIPIPTHAEFDLVGVDDPYGYASAAELSLFRRPLPTTNIEFLSAIMWDGRESPAGQSIEAGLLAQANAATVGHAEATQPLTAAQRAEIVAFQLTLFTAQTEQLVAGELDADSAEGGPYALSNQLFYIGINDVLGADPLGLPFDPVVFTIFSPWSGIKGAGSAKDAKRSVARGQALFNTLPIQITGVAGINDDLGVATLAGTCTTCHDSPNVGNHSVPAPLDLGLTDASRRTPDLPLYTVKNRADGTVRKTTDPGRALITGKWKDIGRFKGPILRGLSARAPYFHNGSAASLAEVVEFYDERFQIGMTSPQKADLVAFLGCL
jgi:cytochrome c peroxidase